MMAMMTTALLMMALLGHPAATKPTDQKPELGLKYVIDLFNRSMSLPKGDFDNLSDLAEGPRKCGAKFFCKAHELLDEHKATKEIAMYLNIYNKLKEFKCKEVLKEVRPTGYQYQMEPLKEQIIGCIRYKIMHTPVKASTPPTNATQPSI
ncbi:uncharacterized protein LOC144036569 [Vanacampus margaritifer]